MVFSRRSSESQSIRSVSSTSSTARLLNFITKRRDYSAPQEKRTAVKAPKRHPTYQEIEARAVYFAIK
jgi:hypothetical protein